MKRIIVGTLLLLYLPLSLFSQTTGKISGTIKDAESGEPLIGVNVIVEGSYLGASSDMGGRYFILNVPPGSYTVKFMYIGYATKRVTDVLVSVNRTSPLSTTMQESSIEFGEDIVVTADKVTVKKDQTSSIRNVSSEEMNVLPVESTGGVVALQPGVVQGHFRGGRSNETSYLIDGISVNNGLNRGKMIEIDPDAVQEVEVITGTFSAKYGQAMSGIVNAVTKEGGESFHGKFEGYLGNYYTSRGDIFMGLKPSEMDRNEDYKFMLHGPVIGDRLTFFASARIQDNDNYLNGIRRFSVTDQPDYSHYQDSTAINSETGEYRYNEHTGDDTYVPMSWVESINLNGKLTYKLTNLKMSLMYLRNQSEQQWYSHSRKYKPDGRSRGHNNSQMLTYQLNHILGKKLFYEAKFSYSKDTWGNYLYEDPLDSRYIHDHYSTNSSYTGFVTGGQDKGHSETVSEKMLGRLDITWQANYNHSIEAGLQAEQYNYDYRSSSILNFYRNTSASDFLYTPEIMSDSTIYTDSYQKKPYQFSTWLSDKMEYDNMVIEFGVRGEYFDPNSIYPSNYRNPSNLLQKEDVPEWTSTYPKAEAKAHFAPRLGLSYKLGEAALLRFSYGHFYQYPPHSTMYQNNSYVISPTNYSSTLGNPNVEPEMTVSYEIGLWQALNDFMDFEVALWYRDIYNLSTVNIVTTYNTVQYGLYGNKDYGNARGLELKYKAHVSNFFAEMNYTLQYTRGNADNPIFTFSRAGNSQDPIPTLIPMSWDQRHTVNLTAGYNKDKWGVTVIGWAGSGSAYSWSPIDQNPLNRINLYPNGSSKPYHYNFDLKAQYEIATVLGADIRATLRIYNLFDRLNENVVNSHTGRTNQSIIRPSDLLGFWSDFSTYEESIYSPSNWSAPRLVKLGIGVSF
jgi:outer membrane receptor protein involved in Fe transport